MNFKQIKHHDMPVLHIETFNSTGWSHNLSLRLVGSVGGAVVVPWQLDSNYIICKNVDFFNKKKFNFVRENGKRFQNTQIFKMESSKLIKYWTDMC
jgi:hypothetical protein